MTDPKMNPCRFCGETEKLTFSDGAFPEQHWGVDDNAEVMREQSGEPYPDCDSRSTFDGVWCDICGAGAPIHVWNGSPDFMARMRANIAAADAEYDDAGIWLGRATAVAA